MKLYRSDLYHVAGVGMIVGAFFAAAKAAGGVLALIFIVASTDFTPEDTSHADAILGALQANHISSMVH